MNPGNFLVRPHRRLVEKFARPESWLVLGQDDVERLVTTVAGLPTELDPESEEAKRFDLLALNLQLARLRSEPGFVRLQEKVREIAGLLGDKASIPMVRAQMALIQDVQSDEWWQDVTVAMLEVMRRRLRGLVQLIDKQQRRPIYTNFEDLLGPETVLALPGISVGTDVDKFRAKARAFLRRHLDHITITKLRTNRPLTASDLAELEDMLAKSGVGAPEDVQRAASEGLGLFVRSLVGLDRAAAKGAMAGFIDGRQLTANQLEFVDLIVNDLTERGYMEPARLYESPFTDLAPQGPDGLFQPADVTDIMRALEAVKATAVAA
jgi:type I restriction enzyme R subunit